MGDAIHVEYGARPWEPTPESYLVEVLDYWDMPTVGFIDQDGNQFLFWCETGINDDVNVWGYVLVDEEEVEYLLGASDFDSAFADLIADRPKVVALHRDSDGIVSVVEVEPTSPHRKDFAEALETAVRTMEQAVKRIRETSHREVV